VAEGVETPEHLQALRAMGCELAQGFVIARPMPAEDLPGWCRQRWDRPAGQPEPSSLLSPPSPASGG
jgi:sensor c-di-GMP phosphodiesterase-like protein